MTTDRDFDGIAQAWLAEGPAELSDRVLVAVVDDIHQTRQRHARRLPRRFPTMTISARASALLLAGALAAAAGFAIVGGIGTTKPAPTPSPSATPSGALPSGAVTITTPALSETFTSTRNGFSVGYPAGWTVKPATGTWRAGSALVWGNSGLDVISTDEVRLNVAAQPLLAGQTESAWYQANCAVDTPATGCATIPAAWEKVVVDGVTGYRDANGEVPPVQGVVPGGVLFAAIVVTGGHAYQIVMDGHVDRAMFDAFLETVRFAPDDAIDLPPVAETFESHRYGYRIGVPAGWFAAPASASWTIGGPVAWPVADTIKAPTGETIVNIASTTIPSGTTFDGWLAELHSREAAANPGCDGGDPATWPAIAVSDQTGRLETRCNLVEALVEVGGRGYVFTWEDQTSDTGLNLADWKELLATSVRFEEGSVFTSPRDGYSIHVPSGWSASPATKPWLAGTKTSWGDPALDTIETSDAHLAIASQPLAGTFYFKRRLQDGQTPDQWLVAHCGSTGPTAASCGTPITIGGQRGWLHADGEPASGAAVATGGVIYDAAVVYEGRGYEFTLDGKVDRALFETFLASVTFDPDGAIDLAPLTKTFTSPTYGYTIGLPESFSATPATSRWTPGTRTDGQDVIGTTGKLDQFVWGASTAIPAGTTFDEWIAATYPPSAANAGCVGDRATIQIGNHVGKFSICGNWTEALVEVGGRAYLFLWMTQVADVHHTLADWKEILKSVTFDPGSATP